MEWTTTLAVLGEHPISNFLHASNTYLLYLISDTHMRDSRIGRRGRLGLVHDRGNIASLQVPPPAVSTRCAGGQVWGALTRCRSCRLGWTIKRAGSGKPQW